MSSYRMKYYIGNTQYNIPVADDLSGFGSGIPLGTILPYSANTLNPPEGFLFCDGSAISRSMYPDLFALIGTLYGEGDGVSTFNLPDLTGGKFLEGTGSAGVSKSAGLPNITGSTTGRIPLAGNDPTGAFSRIFVSTGCGSGSAWDTYKIEFDASRSSNIYGNSQTVQPSSVTVRYIIKAFSATTSNSELIDITQYASALNQKLGEHELYDENFTIIYPNGGSESNPAVLSSNSRYVETNPFPGYYVRCEAEIKHPTSQTVGWFYSGHVTYYSGSSWSASFTKAVQYINIDNVDNIIIQTGNQGNMFSNSSMSGSPIGGTSNSNGGGYLCRVKVWKIGRIPT